MKCVTVCEIPGECERASDDKYCHCERSEAISCVGVTLAVALGGRKTRPYKTRKYEIVRRRRIRSPLGEAEGLWRDFVALAPRNDNCGVLQEAVLLRKSDNPYANCHSKGTKQPKCSVGACSNVQRGSKLPRYTLDSSLRSE